MDDVTLTFDPSMFQKGIDSINSGLEQMNQHFSSFAKQSTKKVQQVGLSAMNLVKALAPIGIAFAGIRKAIHQIPELGRTFSIAGDIISKQLLWPLRRELIPILQKFLDWVRDNRAMFLRWGNVVANVFRIIKSIIGGIWDFIKRFWETLSGHLETIFGRSIKAVGDMVNVILFKVAAVVQFIMALFSPLAEFFANIFAIMIKSVKAFISGFIDGLGDLSPELKQVTEWISELASWIFNTTKNTNGLVGAFRTLGSIAGTVVGTAIRLLVDQIDHLITSFKKLPYAVDALKALFSGRMAEFKRNSKIMDSIDREANKRTEDRWKRSAESWKKLYGTVNEGRAFVNATNIKNNNTGGNVTNNNRMNNNITISVDGSKNPQATATEIDKHIRNSIKEQQFRTGTR